MKKCLLLLLVVTGYSYGQHDEFQVHANGLIYDEYTMKRLSVIVDSLNLKFRTCDLDHPYYSFAQGNGTLVKVPSAAAKNLIEKGVSLSEYLKSFPKSKKEQLWILKNRYRDYNNNPLIGYSGLPHGRGNRVSVVVKDVPANNKTSGWVIDRDGKEAIYFPQLTRTEIPFPYGRLVQYVDCMIDTTSQIFFPEAKKDQYRRMPEDSKAAMFIKWAQDSPGMPEFPDPDEIKEKDVPVAYKKFSKAMKAWDSLRLLTLDKTMRTDKYHQTLLKQAADEALSNGISSEQLEFYVARYISKADALKLKRGRIVIGGCSMDEGPRFHAINICRLSAETAQWDIFLRSHLDVMNDRFERVSDGSYAWAGRKTYLKELEELNINATDLLLGTCLRVENVSENHYWGSIGRIGRALADANDKDALEKRLLAMMKDEKLDIYNRLLLTYLFDNYAHHLEEPARDLKLGVLRATVATMPAPIREVWKKGD